MSTGAWAVRYSEYAWLCAQGTVPLPRERATRWRLVVIVGSARGDARDPGGRSKYESGGLWAWVCAHGYSRRGLLIVAASGRRSLRRRGLYVCEALLAC